MIAGIDEAGRGAWAGPVAAGAVVLGPQGAPKGTADSKQLTARARDRLAPLIREGAAAWGVGWAAAGEVDALGLSAATHLAMRRALSDAAAMLARRGGAPLSHVLVDGREAVAFEEAPSEAVIGGDASVPAIAAASILAKTARDAALEALDANHPGYGFAAHKGYGTAAHRAALQRLGPSPAHRMSYKPVRAEAAALDAQKGGGAGGLRGA